MDRNIFIIAWLICMSLIMIATLRWERWRSEQLIDRWAREHNYQLIERTYLWFSRGPFFWRSSKGQTVYYVTLLDDQGNMRRAWVRCGGWFLGLWSDKIAVEWDSPSQPAWMRW